MSCATYAYFGSPRVFVSCCKTYYRYAVTAEVASSSLVVPASFPSRNALCCHHPFIGSFDCAQDLSLDRCSSHTNSQNHGLPVRIVIQARRSCVWAHLGMSLAVHHGRS